MIKGEKLIKKMIYIGVICIIAIVGNSRVVKANEPIENELKHVIENYGSENVEFEDGISIHKGEVRNIPEFSECQLSNDSVVKVDEQGNISPVGSGTVFLSKQVGNKVRVLEIYVPKVNKYSQRFYSVRNKKNRNYYKVFLDPGHGGHDSGALGFGRKESELNLEVAKRVERKLKFQNIEVVMSRKTDEFISLGKRAELANNYGADVFVSIHQNSAENQSANGIETYYHPDKKGYKPLALDIQNSAIKITGARDREVKSSNLAVLRESNMPSALFESGFITNENESYKLADPSYQDKLATGIASGIEKYLRDNIEIQNQDLPVIATGKVKDADSLNVRSGYGTEYQVIGTLKLGEKIEIVEQQNGWYKIKFNGRYGYVSGKYVELDKNKPDFIDINGHWAKNQIIDFSSKGYINGYEDNTFRPDDNVSRAEFVKILNKVFKFTNTTNSNFIDVSPIDWYYNDICIGINQGYINGYEDNTFRPNSPITREEASKIIAKVMKIKGNGSLNFSDSYAISDWAKEYVDALNDHGMINGYEDNTFRPQNNVTRAETVTILSRTEK
ncbi:N-acetylmuramoyl-L-alanine amidase [Paraclostridium sordellii]|uniref:N-acetylmuramoyl-L-alanine amidase n=1 Tax=Paraclostridium sordellii TaxID=1505 RepID=UPI0005DE0D9D|nr:N-acetylmuramoyl-L-alanine amidase [Paeniclostridium sordellii]CEO12189.1 N-acetylmuramoyl-L-alanine amidase [[Clostridium] sordellii] [Paeniclostridium sordellii]CEP87781.1 N-acetylmuramoyl-L-alanine amidase [[Clostridium] sordellii] [Paeniclostridium sordellii]CEP97483.1 N-acetylmuramoyl-L-alanine amidase [[Clostridium] sordellii] [Paeniclostridium sordellii]CEQ01171.1 N-acetylmuramoyl-L-alanine amidase [[Clostridium] sordellii] [Paeniclostridium sordellii]